MPTMLRHKVTGEIWPMNENLMRHPDVEVFVPVDTQFAQAPAPAPVEEVQIVVPEGQAVAEEQVVAEAPAGKKGKKAKDAPPVAVADESEMPELDDLLEDVE
jgi:hypothetical protein